MSDATLVDEPEAASAESPPDAASVATRTKEQSTIAFPYLDLNEAVKVARAIHENAGDQCTINQLAGYMKTTAGSGAFKEKLRTARIFGVVSENVRLTGTGQLIVDPSQERMGRATAFLHVPLYGAVFEKYDGRLLPPDVALEREMGALGVAEKQKAKARQAFQRSAAQAGFFEQGKDRLVAPIGAVGAKRSPLKPTTRRNGNRGRGSGTTPPPSGLPTKVRMLLRVLPPDGEFWSDDEQDAWLDSMRETLRASYSGTEPATDDEAPE